MNTMRFRGPVEVVTIGLKPGEMLLESIKEAIKQQKIKNGVVVYGIGTLKTCRIHHVTHCDFPPDVRFFTIKKPLELSSISGIIADGEPHLHMVVSYADTEVYAGHLENESEVLYLAEVTILVFNDFKMARRLDKEKNVRLLELKD
jgi:uncharacterized protein